MISFFMRVLTRVAAAMGVAALGMAVLPAQAAKFYVDRALGEVNPADKAAVAEPKPVQLIFEFRSKGVPNAKATKFVKTTVSDAVKASGAFSTISETPVDGGALLIITIDNIPEEGAAGKGFAVGLTFGLTGTKVSDYYVTTAEFTAAAGVTPVKAEVRHALHTTLGKKESDEYGISVKKGEEAIKMVMRQSVDHAVNTVAKQISTAGVPASSPAISAPQPAAAPQR